jgi:hypothetical protein
MQLIITAPSQIIRLVIVNTIANSGSIKNRGLNGSSTKGDAGTYPPCQRRSRVYCFAGRRVARRSVPTPLQTAPASTRSGTLVPDLVEPLTRKEIQLPPLSPTYLEYSCNPHLQQPQIAQSNLSVTPRHHSYRGA